MVKRPTAALLMVAALLALPGDVAATSVTKSRQLWATVNVCDTESHADTIGIRGSMPGTGDAREHMFMRFQAQFYKPSEGHWHNLKGGDSGFVFAGSGKFAARQAGHLFVFAPPTGRSYQLRGAVTFEWRRDGEVVRRARRRTTAGHRNAADADPPGFTAESCVIG
jgi:hypothetical protein